MFLKQKNQIIFDCITRWRVMDNSIMDYETWLSLLGNLTDKTFVPYKNEILRDWGDGRIVFSYRQKIPVDQETSSYV